MINNNAFYTNFSDFNGPKQIQLPKTSYIVSQDIAKEFDFTTTTVMRITPALIEGNSTPSLYYYLDEVFLDQKQLRYTELSEYTKELQQALDIMGQSVLIIDETGVGNAVFDVYSQAGLDPFGIVFGSGAQATVRLRKQPSGSQFGLMSGCNVPKADLISSLQVFMEQGRIRRAPDLKFQTETETQYRNFIGRINEKTKYTKYGNAKDSIHDDIIVAHAMATWYASHMQGMGRAKPITSKKMNKYNTNPFDD